MNIQNKLKPVAVVLGGYVNGYSIIQELSDKEIDNIVLLHYPNQLAASSGLVTECIEIEPKKISIKTALNKINEKYDYLVLFPTDDVQLELLNELKNELLEFCFLPFNSENLISNSSKLVQYEWCEKLGIPYPKTKKLETDKDFFELKSFLFPLIIKPTQRKDMVLDVFRSLNIESLEDLEKQKKFLKSFISKGVSFIASEIIPGSSSGSIFAYTAYRDNNGTIINSWIGKKVNQYPDDYGVFSSASNVAPLIIEEQGRVLVEGMDLFGIVEPEFKYDPRDGKYKLMEVNLRSMMWHRMGALSGVFLQYTQWLDALNKEIPRYIQKQDKVIHLVYLKYEFFNLVSRAKYLNFFWNALRGGDQNHFALTGSSDWKPFLTDSIQMIKGGLGRILRRVRT